MELKEYIIIFRQNIRYFWLTIAVFLLVGAFFQLFRPLSYKSYLTLNITRTGIQKTEDYRYDDFYRLQADERFSDTAVKWLSSPRIASEILADSGISTTRMSAQEISKKFKAERVSSNLVEVSYITELPKTGKDLHPSIIKILNKEAESLNESQKEENWFKIIGSDPIVKENKFSWKLALSVSLILGAFFGIWFVFLKHYFSQEK